MSAPSQSPSFVRVTGTVSSSNADAEQLVELCQYVQDTSPVQTSLRTRSGRNSPTCRVIVYP